MRQKWHLLTLSPSFWPKVDFWPIPLDFFGSNLNVLKNVLHSRQEKSQSHHKLFNQVLAKIPLVLKT